MALSSCSSFGYSNSNKNQGNIDEPNIIVPDIDNSEEEDSSNILNNVMSNISKAKEFAFDNFSFQIDLSNGKPIKITASDLIIDFSKLNSLDVNLSCILKLEYENAVIDNLSLSLEQDGYIYLVYKGHAYSISTPRTLNQILQLVNALGFDVSLTNDNQDQIDFGKIISKIKDIISNSQVLNSKVEHGVSGYSLDIVIPEISIDENTKLNSFKLNLLADENYSLKGISLKDFALVDVTTEKKTAISADSSLELRSTGSYIRKDQNQFDDLTASTSSLFQTLTKLGNDKKANIGLNLSLDDQNGKKQTVVGEFEAFASDTFINYDKGDYRLNLRHVNGTKILNDLSIHFQDETLYLSLNNLFHGKVMTTTLADIFTYVSDIGKDSLIKNITDILNITLSQTDFDSLVAGDYSKYEGMIKSFTYTFNQGFEIEFYSKFFGLSSANDDAFLVALDIIEGGKDKGLKDIRLENLNIGSYRLSCTLSIKDSSNVTRKDVSEEEKNYKNYEAITPIFKTLVDIVDNKKVQANLALTYKDTSAGVAYSLNGKIKADMTKVVKDDNDLSSLADGIDHFNKGNYSIALDIDTGDDTMKNKIEVRYQDKNIYLGYNYDDGTYLLKNQFPDSEITKIKDVIDKNTKVKTTSASDSIEETNSILSAIKSSTNYKNFTDSLKEGSIKDLESFVFIDKDNTDTSNLILKVTPDYFLKGSDYEGKLSDIVFSINTTTNQISSITLNLAHSLIDKETDSLSATISFEDYEEDLLNDIQKSEYTVINNASQLVDVFYSLPTTFEKFGIEANASVKYKTDSGLDQEVSIGDFNDTYGDTNSSLNKSFVAVDMTDSNNPVCYGGLGITHPYLGDSTKTADQKVVFDYHGVFDKDSLKLVDGQFIAKYNDNMKISMEKSDVEDIMKIAKSIDENNLLYRYLGHVENGTTGLPLMDMIASKDPSRLLRYKYVKKVELTDSQIVLVASSKLFDDTVTYENDKDETLTIDYDSTGIKKATISASLGKYTIEASLSLTAFDKNPKPSMDLDTGYTVDVAGFKTLLNCLVTTTSHNYMEMEGRLKLNLKVLKISSSLINVDAYAKAKIYIQNNEAYAYLAINNHEKNMSDDGYRMTEYFVKENQIFVCQTKTSTSTVWENWKFKTKYTTTSEYFYTTAEDFTKTTHLIYYLFNYTLDAGSILNYTLASNIKDDESSSSSSTLIKSNDFSKVIKSAQEDKQSKKFNLSLDLGSILNIPVITFSGNQEISLGYSSENILNFLSIGAKITIAGGLVEAELKSSENQFTLTLPNYGSTCPYSENGKMSRYYKFVTACGGFENPNLETYLITSVEADSPLSGDGSKIKDNGKKKNGPTYTNTGSYGSGPTSVFFYHDN